MPRHFAVLVWGEVARNTQLDPVDCLERVEVKICEGSSAVRLSVAGQISSMKGWPFMFGEETTRAFAAGN